MHWFSGKWKSVCSEQDSGTDVLLLNAGIIRHRGKIASTINNARHALAIQAEFGSLAAYVWRFEPGPEVLRGLVLMEADLGVPVEVASLDVTDSAAVREHLDQLRASGPPLRGVIHAAAVFDDTPLADLDLDGLRRVVAPKLSGARHLAAALTPSDELRAFVLFSSTTGLLGVAVRWKLGEEPPADAIRVVARVAAAHPGPAPLYIDWSDGNGTQVRLRSRRLRVEPREETVRALRDLFGSEAVSFVRAE